MQKNYHTHTFRCMHADGSDEDYVRAALDNGFSVIGFSDHCPWPYQNFVSGMRMPAEAFAGYAASIHALQEKYDGQIEILLGLECEYFPDYLPWMEEKAALLGLDYLILGHHFSPTEPGGVYNGNIRRKKDLRPYCDGVCAAMDTGLFSYVAHPDLYMSGYGVFDDAAAAVAETIIDKAVATGTPLEYNLLGLRRGLAAGHPGYPFPDFWRMAAQKGATAILGIDAHTPGAYGDHELCDLARRTLDTLGISVTDTLERRLKK